MALSNFAIVFIGLVFNILIILFVVISVLLIYSLLMITTETKAFDIGVMRLVGLSNYGFVAMVFVQAVMFVLPSIIFAYMCSFPSLWVIFNIFLEGKNFSKGEFSIVPTPIATVEAIAIGLLIPTLSAIVPVQRALAKTLSDSLNTARATLSGTVVVIEDKNVRVVPFILFGILLVSVGITIYVALP